MPLKPQILKNLRAETRGPSPRIRNLNQKVNLSVKTAANRIQAGIRRPKIPNQKIRKLAQDITLSLYYILTSKARNINASIVSFR